MATKAQLIRLGIRAGAVPAPPVGGTIPTVTTDSITERGITWTLAAAVPVGQFASDDYFAVGGEVADASPASAQVSGTYVGGEAYVDRWVHGLMLNPGRDGGTGADPSTTPQGWDSLRPTVSSGVTAELFYDHTKNKDPGATGLSISAPATLSKTISALGAIPVNARFRIDNTSLLTLIDAVPPVGAFRRWAGATSKTPIFFVSDIDWSVLPSITKPAAAITPTAADLISKLGPFQLYMNQILFTFGVSPTGVQSNYGGNIANDVQAAMLFTMTAGTSEADRNAVAYKLIQAGLDIYDGLEFGRRWSSSTFSYGGGMQWLKILLVYTARLLRNAANSTERVKLLAWCDGSVNRVFADDIMVIPITRARIEATPYEAITTRLWPQGYPDWAENSIEWLSRPSQSDEVGLGWNIAYRTINGFPFMTSALIVRLMGAESLWNYSDFFEYADTFFNRWRELGYTTNPYFFAYPRAYVLDYYTANAPRYVSATAPSLVRRESRGRYAWIEADRNFDLAYQPAAGDMAVTVDGSPVSLASVSTTASGTLSTGSTNVANPVVTVADATGIKVGQRVVCANLEANCFVVSVSGTTIGVTSYILSTFSGVAITFQNVFVFDRSLVAVLPTPLTSESQPVTIGYTKPVSGFVRAFGGTGLATAVEATATNRTGQLPEAATTKDLAYSGPTAATRQFSGTILPRSEVFKRLRISVRFSLAAAMAGNDTILANYTGSSGAFRIYSPSGTGLRIFLSPSQTIEAPNVLTGAPLDTLLTLHIILDLTQTGQTAAKKVALVWSGGGNNAVDTSSSTGTLDGTGSSNVTTLLSSGLHAFALGNGTVPFHGSIKEFTIGWGDETLTLPADLTGATFAHDADWGGNGEGVWGQNQLYYAGSITEWNAGLPNRGSYGSLSLSPRRYVTAGDPDSGLATLYTLAP